MKRISMFAMVMLAVLPGITKAYDYHFATRFRVRWSPYVHGLVYGDVKYSPYAFKRGSSGLIYSRLRYTPFAKKYGKSNLVYDNVRYSPYAFGYNRSGLIAHPWGQSYNYHYVRPYQDAGPCVVVYHNTSQSSCSAVNRNTNISNRAKNNYRAKLATRKAKIEQLKRHRSRVRTQKKYNGRDLISAYLRSKNIDFRTNRTLSIENKLISIDFQLKDRNIIIKYWNPEEILALKQQKNNKISSYERYLESYKDFCGSYLNSGGRIYQIITADNTEVLAKLIEYDELKNEQESIETTVVAKADTGPVNLKKAD